MKMKQITAASVAEALAVARKELGEDALMLDSKKNEKGKGVIVTFAIDAADEVLFEDDDAPVPYDDVIAEPRGTAAKPATSKVELSHPAISMVAEALSYHNVPTSFAEKILANLHAQHIQPDSLVEVAETSLAMALRDLFVFRPIAAGAKTTPPERAIMLVGPHGAGKTTTIAKLATELTLHKQKIVLISSDTERLGGADALGKLADILNCPFHICDNRAELKARIAEYQGKAWILVDTSGVSIYEFPQLKALGELATLQGVEPILTCPAGIDMQEAQEMASVFNFLSIERMIVTRLDAVRRLGSLFAAVATGGYALANLSNSAILTDVSSPMSSPALARLMLRHVRERL